MHEFMNTGGGREFKNFYILIYSGFSSKIEKGNIVQKLKYKKDIKTNWKKGGNINTAEKARIYFCLPDFSSKK